MSNMESKHTIGSLQPSNSATSVPSVYSAWDAAIALSAPWLNNPEIGIIQRMPPKRIMYAQGDVHDCFYLIRSGFVHTIVTRPDGSSLLLEIYGPGAIFGEASAFIDKPRYVTVETVTPVVVSRYHAADIHHMVSRNPDLLLSLLQLLGVKHRLLIDKLASFTSASPEDRVIDLLSRIVLAGRNQPIQQPRLTHEQIASMTGLSRVTVTRTLKLLSERRLVATRSKGVEILDPDRLITIYQSR